MALARVSAPPQSDTAVPADRDEPTTWTGTADLHAAAMLSIQRLRWFIRLRWAFLAAALVVLVLERFVIPEARRPVGLAVCLAILAGINGVWYLIARRFEERVRQRALPSGLTDRLERFANVQVAFDLFLLTMILRYTGGIENPLAVFYLFHMVIVSLLLRWQHAVLQGAWAVALYGLLAWGEWHGWITPRYPFLPNDTTTAALRGEFVLATLVAIASGIAGTLYFTMHIAREIQRQENALQRANDALRQSQVAIQDLQRRRSRFMQTAAHQLKSPLTVIQTMTELMRSNAIPPDAVSRMNERIIARCQEGVAHVGELLTLARVQEADPGRHRTSVADVRAVVDELYHKFHPLAASKQIELTTWTPEGGPLEAAVDQRDLQDCLGNLVENAIKYTPGPGKVRLHVTVKYGDDGRLGSIAIHVSDTGLGIDPNLLRSRDGTPGGEEMFEAFRRGANVINAGISGSGLGLSIVREVVEQAGGRIFVASRPGAGSSFTVEFPAHTPGLAAEPPVRTTRTAAVVVEQPPASGKPGPVAGPAGSP